MNRAEQDIYALQNSAQYKALLDNVNANGEQELIWPSAQEKAIFSAFRIGDIGEATYHFDLFKGNSGTGYYIGSRGDTGDYSSLHVIQYNGGTAKGIAHYFVFPFANADEPFVERLEIRDGAAYGMAQFTTISGRTYEDNYNVDSQNWFPAWPAGLE